MPRNILNETIEILERLQKEALGIKIPEHVLVLMYQYPTSKVDLFYERAEKFFHVKFEHKPDTLSEMARIILGQAQTKQWWE